jgi:branched-chain amino acid transport system substrate-binding protein
MSSTRWKVGVALAAGGTAALLMASLAFASGSSSKGVGTGKASATKSVCGLGTGKKATGSGIKLGAIATKQPGTDFTDIPNMAAAYFKCVNDNGGINGHRIDYSIQTEQTDPGQVTALAKKLVESQKVLGLVGNTSIIDCAVNHKYYESKGIYVIDSGIAPECYATSNSAAVNMGPRYSSDGAAQYVIRQGVNKIVFDQSNVPGTGYNAGGVELIAKAANIPETSLTDDVPIQDANSVALKLVQAAGQNGGIVLNFTPDQALIILQAAQQQGLVDRVKSWACSTPCNSDFVASTLGTTWDGKFGVNAELNLASAPGPDSSLYGAIIAGYKPKLAFGVGSFSQMGFVEARIAVAALLTITGPYTVKGVNTAFKNVKNFKTDILCKPWYYGSAPLHVPNNFDRTVTPSNGKMVQKEGCFPISAVDPAIAQVRAIEKKGAQ